MIYKIGEPKLIISSWRERIAQKEGYLIDNDSYQEKNYTKKENWVKKVIRLLIYMPGTYGETNQSASDIVDSNIEEIEEVQNEIDPNLKITKH